MDQVKEIAAALEELCRAGGSELWIDPGNTICVTFEARDQTTKGDPFWIQVHRGTLNMQCLERDDPSFRMRRKIESFPLGFRETAWQAGTFVTFEMPQLLTPHLPGLIDRVFRQYFSLAPDYQLTYQLEDMG